MTINIHCWTTSKEEADKLVDELSEGCYEYGKDESEEKILDVFYKTKALKNYVGIMQRRIGLLTARIAELEEKQRWIPVSERLPEAEQDVLVFDTRGDITIDFLVAFNRDGVAYYTNSDDGAVCWMPLPTQPEVQE